MRRRWCRSDFSHVRPRPQSPRDRRLPSRNGPVAAFSRSLTSVLFWPTGDISLKGTRPLFENEFRPVPFDDDNNNIAFRWNDEQDDANKGNEQDTGHYYVIGLIRYYTSACGIVFRTRTFPKHDYNSIIIPVDGQNANGNYLVLAGPVGYVRFGFRTVKISEFIAALTSQIALLNVGCPNPRKFISWM